MIDLSRRTNSPISISSGKDDANAILDNGEFPNVLALEVKNAQHQLPQGQSQHVRQTLSQGNLGSDHPQEEPPCCEGPKS